MFVYCINPIDHWRGWHPLRELLVQDIDDCNATTPKDVYAFWGEAQTLARLIGWEGDISGEAGWIPLPSPGGWDYAIAWKQSNNGTTFIATPVKMLWLHPEAHKVINERGEITDIPFNRAVEF